MDLLWRKHKFPSRRCRRALSTASVCHHVIKLARSKSRPTNSTANSNNKVDFTGIRVYVDDRNLPDSAFRTIAPGEIVEVQWDTAQVHDLSSGGDFEFSSAGSLRYAEEGSNEITGQVVYDSGVIHASVDGAQAASVHAAFHQAITEKRVTLKSDCNSSQKKIVTSALSKGKSYATAAQSAAKAGTRLEQYFRSSSSSTKNTVSSVFGKVANVLGSTTSGANLYCSDVGNFCSGGVAAYCQPGTNGYIVVCDGWFTFPSSSSGCRSTDQAQVLIHEATHLSEVAGTDDVCYGYEGCVNKISTAQSLNNADSFAIYANGIKSNC
ncbi:metalloproteinase [Colletotrichum truncatum]|uniref:Metalloproteinase n=1 Tax=Colletotrichum truncatum TaxID=5467 RepID=A0ACC3YI68_COLTU|nr:metalloproteinase [Colletotrichum truncatum]KAF6786128.1 metalloproteinase [Colletotrichum truncatum]